VVCENGNAYREGERFDNGNLADFDTEWIGKSRVCLGKSWV